MSKRAATDDGNNAGRKRRASQSSSSRPQISEDDYYVKSTAFRMWLRDRRDLYLDELSSKDARHHFAKFVKRWNSGDLHEKYYEDKLQMHRDEGTRYRWKFAQDAEAAETARLTGTQPTASHRHTTSAAEDDDQDARDRQRRHDRADRAAFKRTHTATLDELVPKETGRDALLEKRQQTREFHRARADRDDVDMVFADADLMGSRGDDDYRAMYVAPWCFATEARG
ncbi:hypothetical protein RI367_001598 [Sorochytrium milnesiophthora]